MYSSIELKTYQNLSVSDPANSKVTVAATFDPFEMSTSRAYLEYLTSVVAEKIAEKFVEENYSELISKLDQQAIANLAVADSGKKIAEEIRTRPVVLPSPGALINNNKYSIF